MSDKKNKNKSFEALEIHINEFGQIVSNTDLGKLNEFLNERVEDKKLVSRNTLKQDSKDKNDDK